MVRLILAFLIIGISIGNLLSASTLKSLKRVKRLDKFPNVNPTFDCRDRPIGFYADEQNCQIFYMCDAKGKKIQFQCPNSTYFSQQYRVCSWAYDVKCEDSVNWYYLNELTYATDPPKPNRKKPVTSSSVKLIKTPGNKKAKPSSNGNRRGKRYFSRRIYY